jgi:hypothetical protein
MLEVAAGGWGEGQKAIEPAGMGLMAGALALMIDTKHTLDYDPTKVFGG